MQSKTTDGAQGAKHFIPVRRVWERYGLTSMTLWRWLKHADLKFHCLSTALHSYPTNSCCAGK